MSKDSDVTRGALVTVRHDEENAKHLHAASSVEVVVLSLTRPNFCRKCGVYTGQVPASWESISTGHQCDYDDAWRP